MADKKKSRVRYISVSDAKLATWYRKTARALGLCTDAAIMAKSSDTKKSLMAAVKELQSLHGELAGINASKPNRVK